MNNFVFKKGLVVGIIFLFIGVGVQPVFAKGTIKTTISETLEDCGCQPVSNHNFNRLEKFEELSNRITTLKEINEKQHPPAICKALNLMIASLLIIAYIYSRMFDKFYDWGFHGLAEMIRQMFNKISLLAEDIGALWYELGCDEED